MKLLEPSKQALAWAVILTMAALLAGCENKVAPVPTVDYTSTTTASSATADVSQVDAKRLNDGASKLIDAMKMPSTSFHFSYNGQENLQSDPAQPAEGGPVAVEADVSPQEIDLKETQGKTIENLKAQTGNEVKWGMAHMTMVRVMSNPRLVIAVGASVTAPPTADLVGTIAADKFVFDTASDLTPAQKAGLERARMVVSTVQNCRGTAWIDKDSGELVKFNIDAEYQDKNGHDWQEHYEGVVTPN
jgi:hypothetical protein